MTTKNTNQANELLENGPERSAEPFIKVTAKASVFTDGKQRTETRPAYINKNHIVYFYPVNENETRITTTKENFLVVGTCDQLHDVIV